MGWNFPFSRGIRLLTTHSACGISRYSGTILWSLPKLIREYHFQHSRLFVPAHHVVPVMTTKDYGSILMVDGVTPGSTGLLVGSLSGIKKLVKKLVEDGRSEG